MNIAQIQQKALELSKLAANAEALEKRYAAHLGLFDAACMVDNEAEQEQRRNECHTLLDAILDNGSSVYKLRRELHQLQGL